MKYSFYILYLLIVALLVIILLSPKHTQADPDLPPHTIVTHETPPHYTVEEIQSAVISACAKYKGCDRGIALAIVEAETGHYQKFIGDNGTSIGIAQIHLPAHPEVTRTQAENLYFSANFLALNLSEGHCSMWSTCPLAKG